MAATAVALLALAKDIRYVKLIAELLENIKNSANDRAIDREYLWMAAWLVYFSVGRRTAGMEALAMEYSHESKRSRRILGNIVAGSVLCGLGCAAVASGRKETDREGLRGNRRLQAFQQQRQAMLERSRQEFASSSHPTPPSQQINWKNILVQLFTWPSAPHGLPDAEYAPSSTVAKVIHWLVKFHLGWYCYHSGDQEHQIPTIVHRIMGWKLSRAADSIRLHEAPTGNNTARLVGLFLLLTTTGEGFHAAGRRLVQLWVHCWCLGHQGIHQQSIRFEGHERNTIPVTSTLCGICQQPRNHPACSIKCGHVLCWKCWQGWLLEHESCPVCRVPCRTTDVLALYGYQSR